MRWAGTRALLAGTLVLSAALPLATPAGAATVDCSDPQVRQAVQQGLPADLLATYNAAPPDARQVMDQAFLQANGFTFAQLIQDLAACGGDQPPAQNPVVADPVVTDPGMPTLHEVTSGLYNPEAFIQQGRLEWANFRARSQLAAAHSEPAVAAARGGPLADVVLPAVPAGGVPPESSALKLCWQLFSRTDCTDAQAVALYQSRAQPIITALQAQQAIVEAQRVELELHIQRFEDALKSQKVDGLVSALRDDHALVMTVRDDAITGAATALLGGVPSVPLNNLSAASTYLHDAPAFAALLGQKAASGERWTADDTEKGANLATGLSTDLASRALEGTKFAASATFVGRGVAAGQAVIALAEAGTAEYALQQIDLAILKPTEAVAQERALLSGQLIANQLRGQELANELKWRQNELTSVLQYK